MHKEDIFLKKRWEELSYKSYQNSKFYFTAFLSMEEIALLKECFPNGEGRVYSLYSGSEMGERCMARFGNPEELMYEEDFPICLLEIAPLMDKFAEQLGHRDVLGALMNLGIERETIGDIVFQEKNAYVFVTDKIADYILENVDKIRHTNVSVKKIQTLPAVLQVRKERQQISVASMRIDVIIAKSYNLSRNTVLEYMREKKVFCNGRVCENPDTKVKTEDILVLRGFGKMQVAGELYQNKKGKLVVEIEKYV